MSQYAHTAWKVREGFGNGEIISIAQTPDGYLWLGTWFGLLRFDGVRNVPWQPPVNQPLPSSKIYSLLATRDGTLWIGTLNGLASWKDGKLTQYAELAGHYIYKILEDHEGTVWASGLTVTVGRLCAIRDGNVQCYGEDGSLGRGASNLYEDSKGNLWAAVDNGVWRWRPGPPAFYSMPDGPYPIDALGEDADGALLLGWNSGLYRLIDGKSEAYPLPGPRRQFRAERILRDRDGGLWIGTFSHGLLHVHGGRTDIFAESDGLSGERIHSLFEDREGNIWVATINGLDRFRNFGVATLTSSQGLSSAIVGSVLADRDGSVWLGTFAGLNRWHDGQVTIPHSGSAKRDGKLNKQNPHSLFQDDRGRIWISTAREFGYLEDGRFISVSAFSKGPVLSIAQDNAGNLWLANETLGLLRVSPRNEVRQIPWANLGHKDHASVLAIDPSHDGLWIGFYLGGIAYFSDGKIRASYTTADGLGEGRVGGFLFDQGGTLWVATEGGLSRLKDGRVTTMTSKNGLRCDTVNWVMKDDDHAFWLYMACGLVRIARSELDAWVSDTKRTVRATIFDSSDGVRSLAAGGHFSPQVARSADGRIWFLPWDGVSVVNPRELHFNKLLPPVHIEQITADHQTYDATSASNGKVQLPARVRDLEIDYTALSLVAPEKVLFRYKLEGFDREWQEAGTRRQAFYTNLSPRSYTFRVMACNNSGVWNEAGALLNFSVAPAYYQTLWFRLSCVVVFLAVLAGLYRLRVRQLAHQFNMRLEERVSERTRIARELHDTLLQSFQGVLLKFTAITYLFPDRPAEAHRTLKTVIEQARSAIAEGRDAVQGLRSSSAIADDLAGAISTVGEELAGNHTERNSPGFHVRVEGKPRNLAPLIGDEVYRIAVEALRNAYQHANAQRIEVEIRYDQRQLRLRVRDNGRGIDPKVLAGGGREGHYGMRGMYERAKLVGGKLAVWSELDSGTETELTVPASIAYAKASGNHRSAFWRRGA